MANQSYHNHRQIVYGYYLTVGLPVLLLMGIAVLGALRLRGADQHYHLLFLLTGYILLMMLFRSRGFALKAQDRAIRAEEGLRYFILCGKRLPTSLTLKQIIALRFAPDEELIALVEKTVTENLTPNDIKKNIQQWRPDTYRV